MIRSGIGYDIHRFADGLKLILGGVEIAHARGLEGHSDADVLSHAIADALQNLHAADPADRFVGVRKMLANVAGADRAEQRVRDGVRENVGV